MASWGNSRSPRGRSRIYREASPASPLTSLSPSSLPQWIRGSWNRGGFLFNGRTKVVLLGAACLILGFMVTSALGPGGDVDADVYSAPSEGLMNDPSSASVLDDPSGFGMQYEQKKRPGIIGSETEEEAEEKGGSLRVSGKKPTVGGALADLHHAVSDKIQSWNPYFVKPAGHKDDDGASNNTSKYTGLKDKNTTLMTGESVKDGISEEDRLGARIRIGKATVLFSGNMFWERCIRTHERHDKEHGYRLHVLRQQLIDDVWSKPAYVLSLLLREMSKHQSERLDWLFWVDADTIILNPYIPIETFLPPPGTEFDDIYLMYSNDWNGLNNGVFPIRVNEWSVQLFAAIVSYRHFKPEDPLVFRDQSAMNALMQEPEYAKHIMQAPQRWFNAYQGEHNETLQPFQVRRGDLLVHFAGVPAREERMQYWLERAEQHLDDWEVPVKSTSYIQEARDFWNEQKDIRKSKTVQVEEAIGRANKLLFSTDNNLNDYGDRLDEDNKAKITQYRELLRGIIEQESTKHNLEKIDEATKNLLSNTGALDTIIAAANKELLKSAHEAIFTGEKDLLDGGFGTGASSPEMEAVSTTVQKLKEYVMAPQETWNRNDLKVAVNDVTEARARLQEKLAKDMEQAVKDAEAQRVAAEAALDKVVAEIPAGGVANAGEVGSKEKAGKPAVGVGGGGEPSVGAGQGGVEYVVVTAQATVEWTTQIVTSTSAAEAAYTNIRIEPPRA